jgi:hypothetical protein
MSEQVTLEELRAKRPCRHRAVSCYGVEGLGEVKMASELDAKASGLVEEFESERLITRVGVCMDCCEVVGRLGVVSWGDWQ